MKLVLILDSNTVRQSDYLNRVDLNLREYDEILDNFNENDAEFHEIKREIISENFSILDSYNCVALHISDFEKSVTNKLNNYFNHRKGILVYFSGGFSSPYLDDESRSFIFSCLPVKMFYTNIYYFLDRIKKENKYNIRDLISNNSHISYKIDNLVRVLISDLNIKKYEIPLKITDIKLTEFVNLVELSNIDISLNDLLISLEDYPILVSKFVENLKLINQSFAKHGKNIYGWGL